MHVLSMGIAVFLSVKNNSAKRAVNNFRTCLIPLKNNILKYQLFMLFTYLYAMLFVLIIFDHDFDHSDLENVFKKYITCNNILCQSTNKCQRILHHDCNFFTALLLMQLIAYCIGFDFYFVSFYESKILHLFKVNADYLHFNLYLFITKL